MSVDLRQTSAPAPLASHSGPASPEATHGDLKLTAPPTGIIPVIPACGAAGFAYTLLL